LTVPENWNVTKEEDHRVWIESDKQPIILVIESDEQSQTVLAPFMSSIVAYYRDPTLKLYESSTVGAQEEITLGDGTNAIRQVITGKQPDGRKLIVDITCTFVGHRYFVFTFLSWTSSHNTAEIADQVYRSIQIGEGKQYRWVLFLSFEQGFRISYPSAWKLVPMKAGDLKEYTGKIGESNPEFGKSLYAYASRLLEEGVRFLAVSQPAQGKGINSASQVFVRSKPVESQDLAEFVKAYMIEREKDPLTTVKPSKAAVILPAGDSVRINYTYQAKDGTLLAVTEYYLFRDKVIHNIVFSCPVKQSTANAALFQATAETFRYYP
jgi:hypothetical protein